MNYLCTPYIECEKIRYKRYIIIKLKLTNFILNGGHIEKFTFLVEG